MSPQKHTKLNTEDHLFVGTSVSSVCLPDIFPSFLLWQDFLGIIIIIFPPQTNDHFSPSKVDCSRFIYNVIERWERVRDTEWAQPVGSLLEQEPHVSQLGYGEKRKGARRGFFTPVIKQGTPKRAFQGLGKIGWNSCLLFTFFQYSHNLGRYF